MKRAALGLILLAACSAVAYAQQPAPKAPPAAKAPGKAAKADLSGLWVISNRSPRGNLDEAFKPLKDEQYLTADGLKAVAEVRPALDPSAACLPSIPRQLSGPYPIEIMQVGDRMVQLFEWDNVFRLVYFDGRKHPDPDSEMRFMGHAVGAWEGGTLKVDTANFNGKAWLEGRGLPMSKGAHMTEWYSLAEGGKTLQLIAKIEDPKYLSRPVWRKYLYNRKAADAGKNPDAWEINEYLCAEGNRDNVFEQREGLPGSLTHDDVIKKN